MKRYFLLIILLFCNVNFIVLPSENIDSTTLNDIIREKKKQLDVNKEGSETIVSFTSFDLQLTVEEREIFESLQIKNLSPYNLYGSIEGKETEISEYITSLGNDQDKAQYVAQIIINISKEILTGFDAPAAWITLRSSHPNHQFDIPRWHTDGYFYPPFEGLQYKFAVTLQGPGTLLSEVTTATRNEYIKIYKEAWDTIKNSNDTTTIRERLIQHSNESRPLFVPLFPQDKIVQATALEGILFTVGNQKGTATFHSEPSIDRYRLFMSIVPGTIEQIEYWRNKQK